MTSETIYDTFKQLRQVENHPCYRVLLSGYFKEQYIKKESINTQQFLKQSISPFLKNLTGYLYMKGVFYLHLIESHSLQHINEYLNQFHKTLQKQQNLHNQVRIVYQSFQNPNQFFKGWECDVISQNGPVLVQTEKSEEQIADRSFEIYEALEDGAKKKKQNASHKISNMFLLSNDDMSLLICERFMTLEEYHDTYIKEVSYQRESSNNYPLPPSIFNIMEFLEIENYEMFK